MHDKATARQQAMILAALRFWQRGVEQGLIGDEIEIARCGCDDVDGETTELSIAEIDELCEALNWSDIALLPSEE